MRKLPIQINALITSECWTYYKMAIIETSPCRHTWMASHIIPYVSNDFRSLFGENGTMYPLNYYSDILSMDEIFLQQVNDTNIIERIIKKNENGYYIIIDCNLPMLFREECEGFYLHETLLFGFDEKEKVFFTTALQQSRIFKDVKIPFHRLINSFKNMSFHFKNNPETMVNRRNYFYNITRLRLNEDYCEDNSIYLMLKKLSLNFKVQNISLPCLMKNVQ